MYDSIPARFLAQATTRPTAPGYYVRTGGGWKATNWKAYVEQTRQAARALAALGIGVGDAVCILGFNRPEWVIMDVATMLIGGVPAGIYTTCSPPEVQYIVDHAEAGVVLLEDEGQWNKIAVERDRLPKLRHVVMMRGAPPISDPMVMSWDEFMAKGAETPDEVVDERVAALEPDQPATFIYTSGTTGPPKAVMLSHDNLAWTAATAQKIIDLGPNDCSISYLPLSHIAEQMFTIHGPITAGSPVYFAESLDRLKENIVEVQPTVFFGVPRIWEKFHAALSARMAQATGAKKVLLDWAMSVGRQVSDLKNRGDQPSGLLALQYLLADRLVYSKVKPALGLGRARMLVSGAAPISLEILLFFAGLDLRIHEVYGQSEDSGPTSFNLPGRTKFGSVGPALQGVDVRIADDGEITVRGPNVFLGYYKAPEATAETLIDGWLHSGDLGRFDDEGFLYVTGRKKDIIITAGGKNIAPKNIESALKDLPLVAEAVVVGDRRKYLAALITLDPEAVADFLADEEGITRPHEHAKVVQAIQRGIDEQVNPQFARVEHVRKFRILPRTFSIEDGELTPTLKIKRNVINERYAELIDSIYAEDDS